MDNQYNNFGFDTSQSDNEKNNYNQNTPLQEVPEEQYYSMGFNTELPKKNKGGGFFSFLIAFILVIGLALFLLDYTGKIDTKSIISKVYHKVVKKDNKENQSEEDPSEEQIEKITEEDVSKLCNEMDENGFYNKELIDNLSNKISSLPQSATIKERWEIIKGAKYCLEGICYIYEEDDNHNIHEYEKKKKKYNKSTLEEEVEESKIKTTLVTLCSNVDSKGNYVDSSQTEEEKSSAYCENFVCKIKIEDKEYIRNCKE